MSHSGQPPRPHIAPFEQAPLPLAGYAFDYRAGHRTGQHAHPRAQLLYAIDGVMRVATAQAWFIVPPGTGLWMPAHATHEVSMPGGLRMRALFLREEVAAAGPDAVTVIAVSDLLRALILTACAAGPVWAATLPVAPVVELVLHEIRHASTRPLGLPACRDPRLAKVTAALLADPMDERDLAGMAVVAGASERTLSRLFRRETGMSFQQWRRQLRLSEALARIAQGETPARAAALVGYRSGPAFGAAFRAQFGLTPGQVRAAGTPERH